MADVWHEAPAPIAVAFLGARVAAVPMGRLRATYIAERLTEAPAIVAMRILACALRESLSGEEHGRAVVATIADAVTRRAIAADVLAAISMAAVMASEHGVVALLTPTAENDLPTERDTRRVRKKPGEDEDTLGHRKARARTASGDRLWKCLLDPHPAVVENALQNPATTEIAVVRLCAKRPGDPAILGVVAKSRFFRQPQVRRALLLNPATPLDICVHITATLRKAEVVATLGAPGLSPVLVGQLQRRLADG